jgi:hypothetical protein
MYVYYICVIYIFQFYLSAEEVLRFSKKMALELSKRAQQILNKRDFLDEYTMLCWHDPFNRDTNKNVSPQEIVYVRCKCTQNAPVTKRC